MKELTLVEATKALKEGKRIRTAFGNYIHLNEKGDFVYGKNNKGSVLICEPCTNISDFEKIINGKRFFLDEDSILNDKEKEYLGNIVKPFKGKYGEMVITKRKTYFRLCYIIEIKLFEKGERDCCCESICLPSFDKDEMYKGMKADREYTLEELGL